MFDVKKFNDRQGWTIKDLANRLFENGGESRVGMWKSGDSNPRYETILKLIKLGATAEELFGREYAEILLGNSAASAEQQRKRKDARMKTVAYIYTLLVNVANKTITPEQALEMIRQLLSL